MARTRLTSAQAAFFFVDEHDGSVIWIMVDVCMFLRDGGPHESVWSSKGKAGIDLCMLCANMVREGSGLTRFDS